MSSVLRWRLWAMSNTTQAPTTVTNIGVVMFTVADVGSKVLYGVLLAKVLRLRSAADGYGPAREPADGAVGERPEDEPYPGSPEPVRAGNA